MAGQKEATKHLALAHAKATMVDEDNLNTIPGWELLTADQKRFLTILPYYKTLSEAALFIGRDYKWARSQQRTNVVFKGAVEHRSWAPVAVARAYGADLMGKALFVLDELLSPGSKAPPSTRLDAAKTVLRINGIHDAPKQEGVNALFVNTDGGSLFGPPPDDKADAIPAASTISPMETDGDDNSPDPTTE
jgi:hypothetical protein